MADLDGRPGDELVVFIPNYGLVALGMTGDAGSAGGIAAPSLN